MAGPGMDVGSGIGKCSGISTHHRSVIAALDNVAITTQGLSSAWKYKVPHCSAPRGAPAGLITRRRSYFNHLDAMRLLNILHPFKRTSPRNLL